MNIVKKICIFLILILITGIGADAYCVQAEEPSVNIVSLGCGSFGRTGDIFCEGEDVFLETELRNGRDIDYEALLTVQVSDACGQVVWTNSESFILKAKSRMVRGIYPKPEKQYGSFDVKLTLSGNFGTTERTGGYTKTVTPNQKNGEIGYATHLGYPIDNIDDLLPVIKNSGAGVIRDGIKWSEVEKTKGVLEIPAYYDDYVNKLIDNGIQVIVQLGFHNEVMDGNGGLLLYESDNGFPNDETSLKAYADYVSFVAEHFKGRIDVFEIWNEPNAGYYLEMADDRTPQDYVRLLKTGYDAVKNSNPQATVLGGVVTSPRNPSTRNWIEDFFDNGGGEYFDAFCVHPYRDTGFYMDENEKEWQSDFTYNAWDFDEMISFVKKCMTDAGVGSKKIVITEVGTSSSEVTGEDFGNYTEHQQAVSLTRIAAMSQANADIDYTCFYNLRERSGDTYSIGYGNISYGYNGKPAYAAVVNYNKHTAGSEYVDKMSSDGNFTAYQFKNENEKQIYILWANARNKKTANITYKRDGAIETAVLSYSGTDLTLTIPQDCTAELYDIYGNKLDYSENVAYTFNEAPIYLVCRQDMTPEITRNGDFLNICGRTEKANETVTLVAKKRGIFKEDIVYIDQQNTDSGMNYDFSFYAADNALYEVFVYDGEYHEIYPTVGGYEIDITYYIDNALLTDASQLNSGEKLKAVLSITKPDDLSNLIFIGAVYGTEKTLQLADLTPVERDGSDFAVAEVEVPVYENTEDIKVMLWNEEFRPIFESLDLK